MRVGLIYPHQLFSEHPVVGVSDEVWLIEDPLFFRLYRFHAQKLVLHRASMKAFEAALRKSKVKVVYVEALQLEHSSDIGPLLKKHGATDAVVVDPCDDWLTQRLSSGCAKAGVKLHELTDPNFLTPWKEFDRFAEERDHWFFTDFYVQQRKRLNLLLDERGKPLGGKWSFDRENRKKLPSSVSVPRLTFPKPNRYVLEAQQYVSSQFPTAPGKVDPFRYPVTSEAAEEWLETFLDQRLEDFGLYEDAISPTETFLFHSVLTPPLNIGLIKPTTIVEKAIERIDSVPFNSLEGFVRQVIGWREFIRGVYRQFGRRQRTTNYWDHQRAMPKSFYDGTTGIEPFDAVIKRVVEHAYCHHIERLMIAGNFMLLCEIDPDEVYRWFMELFIDAYDWVMVPNVYGMSQHADGGLMTTKPYISGSSYVLKMSGFRKGDWCEVWDGLYWRFIAKHRKFFESNPRMSVMTAQLDRMGDKLATHKSNANRFLKSLE